MDANALIQAIQTLNAEDALRMRLDPNQWQTLISFLTQHKLGAGELLIKQGEMDRTLYFLQSGTLQVYVDAGTPGNHKIALLQPGAVVGEAGFFAAGQRTANVEALSTCVVWALRLQRFEELAVRQPPLALELVRRTAATLAIRMRHNMLRQIPIT